MNKGLCHTSSITNVIFWHQNEAKIVLIVRVEDN